MMRRILNLKINLIPEVSLDEDQEYSLEMCTVHHLPWGLGLDQGGQVGLWTLLPPDLSEDVAGTVESKLSSL